MMADRRQAHTQPDEARLEAATFRAARHESRYMLLTKAAGRRCRGGVGLHNN